MQRGRAGGKSPIARCENARRSKINITHLSKPLPSFSRSCTSHMSCTFDDSSPPPSPLLPPVAKEGNPYSFGDDVVRRLCDTSMGHCMLIRKTG